MAQVSDAVAWALNRYNEDPEYRRTNVEIGNVLYSDRNTGLLLPGPDVYGDSASAVRPYDSQLPRLLEAFGGQGGLLFLGDYHCHVGSGLFWTDHVPSPEDLSRTSCLGDLWALEEPLVIDGHTVTDIPMSPSFQLMQANLFGDVFVIERISERKEFSSLQEQEQTLREIERAYSRWHMVARARYDALNFPLSHSEFVGQVRSELAIMNAALANRAVISLVENGNYVSDDDDFLSQ